MKYSFFIFAPLIIFFVTKFFKNNNKLLNYSGDTHQKFLGEKKIPLLGGIFFISFLIFILKIESFFLLIFVFLIFLIGFSSDTKFVSSPLKRLIIQLIIIILFVIFFDLHINSTRIIIIDYLLNNFFFSIFFTSFCLIILMNGSNFIDGLNGLVIGYFLLILLFLYQLDLIQYTTLIEFEFLSLIYLLLILLFFNLFNKFYLGDSGSYCLSFFVGYLLINIYNEYSNFSPFFIVMLLWYPCFENLFSIIRKFRFKKSPIIADNNHFHQLFYNFIKKKTKLNNIYCNNLTSLIINFYNFLVFYFASFDIYSTQYIIILILINVFIYSFLYIKFFEFKYRKIKV